MKHSQLKGMKVGDTILLEKKPDEAITLGALAARAKSYASYQRKITNQPFTVTTLRVWRPRSGVLVTRIK